MKSETKYREKLIVNETLRKRCDINSDREKPYDSHDFLKLPHRFSIIKSLKNQQKNEASLGIAILLEILSKKLPKYLQNAP